MTEWKCCETWYRADTACLECGSVLDPDRRAAWEKKMKPFIGPLQERIERISMVMWAQKHQGFKKRPGQIDFV